jgi:hypothetical protein
MIPLIFTVATLGLVIGIAARSAVQRRSDDSTQRSRRTLMLHAGAMFLCAAILTTFAITTERLRYINIPVAILTAVYGVNELRKLRRGRQTSAS